MARLTHETKRVREGAETEETKTAASGKVGDGNGNGATNAEAMAPMITANEAMLAGLVAVQQEFAAFSATRLHQGMEAQEALTHCGDLQEAFRLQADFAQRAMQHYTEESAKLFELSAKASREFWSPFEDATRAAMQKVAPR